MLIERPVDALARDPCGAGIDGDDIEIGDVAVAERREILLHADEAALRQNGKRDVALDRTSARLADAQNHLGFERLRRGDVGDRYVDCGIALVVRRGDGRQILAHRLEGLVLQPGLIAPQNRKTVVARRLDRYLASDIETGARCAVEIARIGVDRGRVAGAQLRLRAASA